MPLKVQDFISIQKAAKRLNMSTDQVMFLIEDGRLTGYARSKKSNIIFSGDDGPRSARHVAMSLPIRWNVYNVLFKEAVIFNENYNFHEYETNDFKEETQSIKLNAKEVDQYERERNIETTEREPSPNFQEYVQIRRTEGVQDGIIAVDLNDKKGRFRLSYLEVARALGLDKGLNDNQIAALKQRGCRKCKNGKDILKRMNKTKGA